MRTTLPLALSLLFFSGCGTPTRPATYQIGSAVELPARDADAALAKQIFLATEPSVLAGRIDQPIQLLIGSPPALPAEAARRNLQGIVRVTIHFAESGLVEKVVVNESPDDVLSKAVESALLSWRIVPLTKQGKPTKFGARQAFTFRLQ